MTDRRKILAFGIVAGSLILAGLVTTLFLRQNKSVDSFQACKGTGGAIMESYPEQCMKDGKSFTNDAQSIDGSAESYFGLTEQAALDKAAADKKTARVVEREGESLIIDMSFMPGRINLYIKDGKVSKVQVEGKES